MTATRAGQHKHHLGHWVRVQSHNFEAEEKVNASPSPNVSQAPNRKFAFNPMEEVVCFLEPGRPPLLTESAFVTVVATILGYTSIKASQPSS